MEHSGYLLYVPPGLTPEILRPERSMYLFVPYGSDNKQRLFPGTALTDGFYNRKGTCSLLGMKRVFKYNLG
jgi:hypothetical protein